MRHVNPDKKVCARCGRHFAWRRKWARNWPEVKYCSVTCRSHQLTSTDMALEKAITALLQRRPPGSTLCPSEAARAVAREHSTDDWRTLMQATRRAARRLVSEGSVQILQNGRCVDPSRAKGPIRLKLVG